LCVTGTGPLARAPMTIDPGALDLSRLARNARSIAKAVRSADPDHLVPDLRVPDHLVPDLRVSTVRAVLRRVRPSGRSENGRNNTSLSDLSVPYGLSHLETCPIRYQRQYLRISGNM
jgi:hypothetical protein